MEQAKIVSPIGGTEMSTEVWWETLKEGTSRNI